VKGLTSAQARDIYSGKSGKITNWADVGGEKGVALFASIIECLVLQPLATMYDPI